MTPKRIAQLEQMLERGTVCKGHIWEMLDAIKHRPWVDLTDEELDLLDKDIDARVPLKQGKRLFARAVLAKAKEKNT
jgi:hypothetical protein